MTSASSARISGFPRRAGLKKKGFLILISILWAYPNTLIPKTPAEPAKTRLLLRWGVWLAYSEWRPDQPHEDWSGNLSAERGILHNPQLVIYHRILGAPAPDIHRIEFSSVAVSSYRFPPAGGRWIFLPT